MQIDNLFFCFFIQQPSTVALTKANPTGVTDTPLSNHTLGGFSRYDRKWIFGAIGASRVFHILFSLSQFSVTEHIDDYNMSHQHRFQAQSPSASLAMEMGTDSHKLQLMKASFFADDDYDGKSVVSEQFEGRDSPDQIVPSRAGIRTHLYSAPSSVHSFSRGLPSTTSSILEIPVPNLVVPATKDAAVEPTGTLSQVNW